MNEENETIGKITDMLKSGEIKIRYKFMEKCNEKVSEKVAKELYEMVKSGKIGFDNKTGTFIVDGDGMTKILAEVIELILNGRISK